MDYEFHSKQMESNKQNKPKIERHKCAHRH